MEGRLPTSLEWSNVKAEATLLVPMSWQELLCSAVATLAPDFFFFLGVGSQRVFPSSGFGICVFFHFDELPAKVDELHLPGSPFDP